MAQAADPQAVQRATTTPLAAAGLFDEDPASDPGSQPPVSQRISVPPASTGALSGSMPIAAASQPSVARDPASVRVIVPVKEEGAKKPGGLVLLLGGLVAAGAVAAGAFFFVQHNDKANTPVAGVTAPVAPPEVVAPPAAAVAPAALAQNDTPAADSVDPSSVAPTAAPKSVPGVAMKKSAAKTAAPSAKVEAAPAPPPVEAVDPKLVAKDLPPSPTEPTGTLADHMKQAAGPTAAVNGDPQAAGGPQFAAGSVPQRPSQGAVTGALGAALSGARACLPPDAAVSQATITFGSTGAVSGVAVTGSAAGKPAEACIKTALGKAKVPPFAQPSYTAKVTVRPN